MKFSQQKPQKTQVVLHYLAEKRRLTFIILLKNAGG